jgi:hypothetical protein
MGYTPVVHQEVVTWPVVGHNNGRPTTQTKQTRNKVFRSVRALLPSNFPPLHYIVPGAANIRHSASVVVLVGHDHPLVQFAPPQSWIAGTSPAMTDT